MNKRTPNKRLRSVCHSIAHHAVSALSYMHPHLKSTCKMAGLDSVEVIVFGDGETPNDLKGCDPLLKALRALRKTFISILASENISSTEIVYAKLIFSFPIDPNLDDYCTNCKSIIKTESGNEITKCLDYLGNEIKTKKAKTHSENV